MISDKKLEQILSKAKKLIPGYQQIINQTSALHNEGQEVAVAAMLMGSLQCVYLNSIPGQAVEELKTIREIFDAVMKTAEEKFPVWDKQRVERTASGAEKETKKLMSKISKSYKDLGPEEEDLVKRKPGDTLN